MKNEKTEFEETGYGEALNEVIRIRLNRKKIYGDSWKEMDDYKLLVFIENKLGRYKDCVKFIRTQKYIYETEIDTLIDLINYSLFLLQNKLNKKRIDND